MRAFLNDITRVLVCGAVRRFGWGTAHLYETAKTERGVFDSESVEPDEQELVG